MKGITRGMTLLLLALLTLSCSKTVVFKQQGQKIRPLKTEAKIIRLHEDFLFAEPNAQGLKEMVLENIKQAMSRQSRFQFEYIPSGQKVPKNNSNRENVFLIGDIWMYHGNTSGNRVKKVTRTRRGFGSSQSWDELERGSWKQDSLQTIVSLYFIEVGSKTRLLRSTITMSNDKRTRIQVGGRTISDKQSAQFYQDKELQAGYYPVTSNSNLNSRNNALSELAKKSVKIHLDTL